jgi:hypothetical protein
MWLVFVCAGRAWGCDAVVEHPAVGADVTSTQYCPVQSKSESMAPACGKHAVLTDHARPARGRHADRVFRDESRRDEHVEPSCPCPTRL